MTQDPNTSLHLFIIFNVIAALFANAFPLLWGFLSPWYKSHLGQAMMLQGVSLALALDTTLAFAVLNESPLVRRSTLIVVFVFLTVSSGYITWRVIKNNYILPMRALGVPLWKPWQHVTTRRLNDE